MDLRKAVDCLRQQVCGGVRTVGLLVEGFVFEAESGGKIDDKGPAVEQVPGCRCGDAVRQAEEINVAGALVICVGRLEGHLQPPPEEGKTSETLFPPVSVRRDKCDLHVGMTEQNGQEDSSRISGGPDYPCAQHGLLSLGELEACPCSLLPVLLSFLDPGVSGDETLFLQKTLSPR